ncbi:MAG: bifunctional folylpolyglutamate synthase/dihydrofolate synthase [Caldisericia bacterium]|nr:bifunctional folylpolyglutamate synthase/dihydrofolate synthase [Caldisericia bacterium]
MFSYVEALDFLGARKRRTIKPGLDRIKLLLNILGNPEKGKRVIHVAGTKGKGSTCVFISRLLSYHGYKVGLFLSPHLQCFRERISINGNFISAKEFGRYIWEIKNIYEKEDKFKEIGEPTLFEILTAISLHYFHKNNVDFVVLETGLGGRLDATNVVANPLTSVITPIGLDHMDILGDTIEKISFEKAGIIKRRRPVILSEQEERALKVIIDKGRECNSKIYMAGRDFSTRIIKMDRGGTIFTYKSNKNFFENLKIKLLGEYQVMNSSLAIKTLEVLEDLGLIEIKESKIRKALEDAFIPGRGEIINEGGRVYILDGAHNEISMREVRKFLQQYFSCGKINLIFGILKDKNIERVLEMILPCAEKVIFTAPSGVRERRTPPDYLLSLAKKMFPFKEMGVSKNVAQAFKMANEFFSLEPVVVTGSFYIVGEARSILKRYYFS